MPRYIPSKTIQIDEYKKLMCQSNSGNLSQCLYIKKFPGRLWIYYNHICQFCFNKAETIKWVTHKTNLETNLKM